MITFNDLKEKTGIVIAIYAIVFTCQMVSVKTNPKELLFGMFVSFCIVIPSIIIKESIKRPNLPGFAWSTLIAAILTLPISPLQSLIVDNVGKINFLITAIPLLAFAGISIGDKIPQLKKMSWKIAIIAIIVMCSTYFGSALIAQTVLSLKGLI